MDDIEGWGARMPERVRGTVIMERTPAEPALAHATHLGLRSTLGEQLEGQNVGIHPADHCRAGADAAGSRHAETCCRVSQVSQMGQERLILLHVWDRVAANSLSATPATAPNEPLPGVLNAGDRHTRQGKYEAGAAPCAVKAQGWPSASRRG
jgi:hypothetical protein